MILGLRIGQRIMAAVAFDGEQVVFQDCRYVAARPGLDERAGKYFVRLIEQLKPAFIGYYAPTNRQTHTESIVQALEREAERLQTPTKRLDRSDVLGVVPGSARPTRRQLAELVRFLWPAEDSRPNVQRLVLAEAATAALLEDMRLVLGHQQ